ncbi:MAG: phosphorylase [Cyanobacteria bacterium J06632_22]
MARKDWQTGKLWERLKTQTQIALETGALLPIATTYELVQSGKVTFIVRLATNLARKSKATKKQQKKDPNFNPFLPYDEDLYVCDISDTHLCLLNKFNVVDHHLLIITRAFETQDSWLKLADFEALALCLAEIDGFAFYNGGPVAGASQRHKHLQLVPLPMVAPDPGLLVDQLTPTQTLPFRCAIAPFPSDAPPSGKQLLKTYAQLLTALGIGPEPAQPSAEPAQQQFPYNLLCTRRWMMVVPRSQESYNKISINALGFAGSLLAKNQARLDLIKATGPMNILQQVGVAAELEGS